MSRELKFNDYTDIISEIQKLQSQGYSSHGKWTLGQVCTHLSYYYEGSLSGFAKPLPWILRVTIGKLIKKQYLSEKPLSKGSTTDPKSRPEAVDDAAAIARAIDLLTRLSSGETQLHPSPLVGELTGDEWKRIHCKHSAHHLGFLS